MGKCKLCKVYEADKKGSHIVPHFLLKRIDNAEGEHGRDRELGFVIEEDDTKSYFGRSLQPEKLEEVFGEISDEEIKENEIPSVVDNIFCSSCEKRLSIIEAEYAKTLKNSSDSVYKSGCSTSIGLLFWMSVIWRMSIHRQYGTHLTSGEEETCRSILDRFLTHSIASIDKEGMKSHKLLNRISYKLMRTPNFTDNHTTLLFFNPMFRNPYSLLVDEYILLFSLKGNYIQLKDFYGIKDELSQSPINKVGTEEKILPIEKEKMEKAVLQIIDKVKNIKLSRIVKWLDEIHVKLGGEGSIMPAWIKQQIFDEITSDEKKIGKKYSKVDIKESILKVLSQFVKQ